MISRWRLLDGKLIGLVMLMLRTSPAYTLASLIAKAAFLLMQLASILLIFSWINQSVPGPLLTVSRLPADSNWFALIGAFGLILSSALSLLSKKMALKGILRVERVIIERFVGQAHTLQKGDLKNIVKVLLSVTDVIVPVILIIAVTAAWVWITPYSLIAVSILALFALPLMRKGVSFSAKRYRPSKVRTLFPDYLDSEEHTAFYKILIMPNYIGMAMFVMISVGLILSVLAARLYFNGNETYAHILIIATAVAFLQARSFVGIILRAGAYNRSITKVDDVIRSSASGA